MPRSLIFSSHNMKHSERERERKFLVTAMPLGLEQFPVEVIEQAYVSSKYNPESPRIRKISGFWTEDGKPKSNPRYFTAVKRETDIVGERDELEREIKEEDHALLMQHTESPPITKVRYRIPHDGHVLELDVYSGKLFPLIVAEVEFKPGEDLSKFNKPEWLGIEVTGDTRYENRSLAKRQHPPNDGRLFYLMRENAVVPRIFQRDSGVQEILKMIKQKIEDEKKFPVMVAVAGGSGTGKTSGVAEEIQKALGQMAVTISMDNYFKNITGLQSLLLSGKPVNLEMPSRINMEQLNMDLLRLKAGHIVTTPIYDFEKGKATTTQEVVPGSVIIVEGLFPLNPILVDIFDIKVFVEAQPHGQLLRRIIRDRKTRTGFTPAQTLRYFAGVVAPMQVQHIDSTKPSADIIIKNDYNPILEARKAGHFDTQFKFRADISDEDLLAKIDAIRVSRIPEQTDIYFEQIDRNGTPTPDLVRLRLEDGDAWFSYKGPSLEKGDRTQPRLEFPLGRFDLETLRIMNGFFGWRTTKITKDRTIYRTDGVIIYVDRDVTKERDHGQIEESLGNFVEICVINPEKKQTAQDLAAKLNLTTPVLENYLRIGNPNGISGLLA